MLFFFFPTSLVTLIYVINTVLMNSQYIFTQSKIISELRRRERLDYEEEVLGLLLLEKINLT